MIRPIMNGLLADQIITSGKSSVTVISFELAYSLFSAGNNPTYGRKLMLKDKCDLDISKHERCVQ